MTVSLFPISTGSRGYANVFGTFLIPSTLSPIAIATVAPIHCEECWVSVRPVQISNGEWNLYPCHNSECSCCFEIGRVCDVCENVDGCCSCFFCDSCSDKTSEYCGDCNQCDDCCTCQECESCSYKFDSDDMTYVDGYGYYCDRRCLHNNFTYCDDCEMYVHYDEDHSHGCECESPNPHFSFPNAITGTAVSENERFTVDFPSGVISSQGIYRIIRLLCESGLRDRNDYRMDTWTIEKTVSAVDPVWQKKDGNFTRRLSRDFYKAFGCKLSPNVLSEVGNIANQETAKANALNIELTRWLNGTAEDFYHGGSCWWQSYSASRCALKNWGGIGMRSYDSEHSDRNSPSGRAWIQPLNSELEPTSDINGAFAFLVYNGYGELDGYSGARAIAAMTGLTYKKVNVDFNVTEGDFYTNGGVGILIANEKTCNTVSDIEYCANPHKEL